MLNNKEDRWHPLSMSEVIHISDLIYRGYVNVHCLITEILKFCSCHSLESFTQSSLPVHIYFFSQSGK